MAQQSASYNEGTTPVLTSSLSKDDDRTERDSAKHDDAQTATADLGGAVISADGQAAALHTPGKTRKERMSDFFTILAAGTLEHCLPPAWI